MYINNLKPVLQNDADMRECRHLLKKGSHSFFAASLLLPTEYRPPITALYAFCRVADDVVDLSDDPQAGLESLRLRLDRIYAGKPLDFAVDRAFSRVVRRHAIPLTLPAALLEGFEWDVIGSHYASLSDTLAYSARVAGTVGVMMAMLMGVRRREVLSRACDLGVAMQLTNIARDVGEDVRAGRVYLPADRLRAHGVDVDRWRRQPVIVNGVRATVKELLDVADGLYSRAEWGISRLPVGVRPGIFAARRIYAAIGDEIRRRDYDSVAYRAYVPRGTKLTLLAGALRDTLAEKLHDHAPPLPETSFLLNAVAQTA